MPTSHRVARDPFSEHGEIIGQVRGVDYAVDRVKAGWRIYEAHSEYSTTSGGYITRGAAVRRYDPDAGLSEQGKIATFSTKDEAVAYFRRWVER